MNRLWQFLTRSARDQAHRKASWFELFFDLAFVAAIATTLHSFYRTEASFQLNAVLIFVSILLIWSQLTFYMDRFDRDSLLSRLAYLVPMFGVLAVGAGASDQENKYLLTCVGFLLARGALILLYARVALGSKSPNRLAASLLLCYGLSALPWVAVLFDFSFALVAVGLCLDLLVPWIVRNSLKNSPVPLSSSHLSERFGLLTLLLLGEPVAAIAKSLDVSGFDAVHLLAAFLVLGSVFGCAVLYFDFADEAMLKQSFTTILIWEYLHYGLIIALAFLGLAVHDILTHRHCFLYGSAIGLMILFFSAFDGLCYWSAGESISGKRLLLRLCFAALILVSPVVLPTLAALVLIAGLLVGMIAFEKIGLMDQA